MTSSTARTPPDVRSGRGRSAPRTHWLPDRYVVGSSRRGYGDMAGWTDEYVDLGVDGVVVDEPDRVE